MNKTSGLTIIELLIALAIIGIAFGALALSQVSSLRASATARLASETKAEANQQLEAQMAKVLAVGTVANGSTYDDDPSTAGRNFWFIDYYYTCPTAVTPPTGTRATLRSPLNCSGSTTTGNITTAWTIAGESGRLGEGSIAVTVTSTHTRGSKVTLVNRITCYDVYPSPTSVTPAPCPTPTLTGGGRP